MENNLEKLLEEVEKIASIYHKGEKRKNGVSYIVHPLNVFNLLKKIGAKRMALASALLHDTIENKLVEETKLELELETELEKLTSQILPIYKRFTQNFEREIALVLNIVYKLTRKPKQDYFSYLYNLFYDRKPIEIKNIKYGLNKKDMNIVIMNAIEVKLADMIDNVSSLPPQVFDEQSVLLTTYKGFLQINETRLKINRLISEKERKFYRERVEKLSQILVEKIMNVLNERINLFEKKLEKKEIEKNYELLEAYNIKHGFDNLTPENPKNYFDGSIIRYRKILTKKASKEFLGFKNGVNLNLNIHRDLIAFRKFTEKFKDEKYRLKGMGLKRLKELI